MTKLYDSILDTVGGTPIVRINNLGPAHVNIYAKVESFNPMGSVKDRLALSVIEDAERKGELKPGQTVIEATSGNTGIGLAMVCAQKGYPLVIVMAENFSVERRKLMRFLGAKVILTPASERGTGMLKKATELAEKHDWFMTRQFENEANADAHTRTTAPEILQAFDGTRLDYFVTGFGTSGTLKGIARVLKEKSPETRIAVCEPDNSQILASGIPQERLANGFHAASHPSSRPHPMQGWGPDFIPKLAEDVVTANLIDEFVPINGGDALRCSRELATQEGILAGISSGATLAGALKVAETAPAGSNILCMLPDTGERYLSTPLFEHIGEDMSADEIEVSRSTPNFRFDQPTTPAPKPAPVAEKPIVVKRDDDEAEAFFADAISDPDQPVVLFALEWCEFCWSVRKMFEKRGIPYRSIDLDSVAYQKDNLGGRIRMVLQAQTGVLTIPQIFVGGKFVGGCTETFDAQNDGQLDTLLAENAVVYDAAQKVDPYSFLPKWLHAR